VDDLLDVTRISRGKVQLRRQRIDFAEVVHRVVEDHRSSFTTNDLHVHVAIPDGPTPIDADGTRVAQVIGNLLHNALKFTPAGGSVSVSVEADRQLGHVIARVRDDGMGIDADMLPRIFEPFTQAATTMDRSRGGLGLGLALVKGLVELHQGQVAVCSEGPGKGAEFSVRFPLDGTADAPQPAPRAVACLPRRVLGDRGQSRRGREPVAEAGIRWPRRSRRP
jgi:two-component system CheB/CheR fusion protein